MNITAKIDSHFNSVDFILFFQENKKLKLGFSQFARVIRMNPHVETLFRLRGGVISKLISEFVLVHFLC